MSQYIMISRRWRGSDTTHDVVVCCNDKSLFLIFHIERKKKQQSKQKKSIFGRVISEMV